MAAHSLVTSLKNLRGNARGCVYTEALWGIPNNLYAPYVSIYMLALGLSDVQIGLITSIGLVFQIVTTLLSGAITDKLGRKRTTLIFDLISWSVPCLIWAVAQNFTYFVVAAIVNSIWRVTANSWQCLLVEDTDPGLLVDIWSWIYIAGLIAAFVSPITGLLIDHYSLVPTMRGLYILSFVMMTAKFLIMNGNGHRNQTRRSAYGGNAQPTLVRGDAWVLGRVEADIEDAGHALYRRADDPAEHLLADEEHLLVHPGHRETGHPR